VGRKAKPTKWGEPPKHLRAVSGEREKSAVGNIFLHCKQERNPWGNRGNGKCKSSIGELLAKESVERYNLFINFWRRGSTKGACAPWKKRR